MRHQKRLFSVLGLAMAGLLLGGCVAQQQADDLRTLYRKSQEQVLDLQLQLEEAQARIAALSAASNQPDPGTLAKLEAALAERDQLRAALADAEQRLRDLPPVQVGALLPQELDQPLTELAELNPELMTYDRALGMVRLRSDLTFSLGSAVVSDNATRSLGMLAGVLKSAAAQPYEVRIVGHTDNVPIRRVRDKHPTNWHLSVHRAIAVKDALEKAGVTPARMSVAGYGQYRPVAPNGPRGAEANRRVEIFLVKMTKPSAAPTPPAASATDTEPATEAPTEPAAQPPAMFK